MLKFKLLLFGMIFPLIVFSKNQLYYGNTYGKKVFVEMREDSTATIIVIYGRKTRGCTMFLEPLEYQRKTLIFHMKFTRWHKNYWITNFKTTKKKESINDLPKEKVEIGRKRSWLYIFNLPDVSVDFPLRKVLRWEYAREEYERYLK